MAGFDLREARADAADEQFLWLMNLEAVCWRPGSERLTLDDTRANPAVARYVAGWGRGGDAGAIAEAGAERLGAAWWRLFTEQDHAYGFIAPQIPEVSLAVVTGSRGAGIGSALMSATIERAQAQEIPTLSLSVEFDNPALRLYQRHGFERVGQVGGAWTMRLDL